MRFKAFALLFSFAVVLFAAKTKTVTDFDPDGKFSAYKTYSIVGGKELSRTGLLSSAENRERVANFVSGELELRGMREVPQDETHDLAVRYWIARKAKTEETTLLVPDPWLAGYPPYWTGAWSWYYEEHIIRNYVEGTLIIDLIDTKTKELVWRTYVKRNIEAGEDRLKAYEELKKQVAKEFSAWPPSAAQREEMKKERAKLERKYAKK
jgi:hypothetical protein